MARDSSFRMLTALKGASTARVLNLHRVGLENGSNPEYRDKPLFLSDAINNAFLLKHRVRPDETYLFTSGRAVVTKIVIPFDRDDLGAGGQAIFVEQRGYADLLRDAGSYAADSLARDMDVLRLLNAVPSFDPFLMREHLLNHKIEVAPCYFAISQGDQDKMWAFVSGEMTRLIALATGDVSDSAGGRLVGAMLSTRVDERLEPLRLTLGLSGDDFREGVFSWRGFLYYKWSMGSFWPDVRGVLRDIQTVEPFGPRTVAERAFLAEGRPRIAVLAQEAGAQVNKVLAVYDNAFADLVANHSPAGFRDFLLSAPRMFLELGEKLGAISHVVSFWRYRFAPGVKRAVDAEELTAILQDFLKGFGGKTQRERKQIKQPEVFDYRTPKTAP